MARLSIVAALAVLSCGPSIHERHLADVDAQRAEAHARPGARQALEFARSVHRAHREGAYASAPQRLAADVDDAVATLERAAESNPTDAPTLVAWQGLLYTDGERYREGMAAFERSHALGPNFTAAANLVLIWGAAAKPDKVGEICAEVVPGLIDRDERFDLIGICVDNMNAISDEAALAWATPAVRAFYAEELERRQAEAHRAARQREARERHERDVARDVDQCIAECKQIGYQCLNDCQGDRRCEHNCESSYQACLDGCEAHARRRLGE